jgi:hypothetical protein
MSRQRCSLLTASPVLALLVAASSAGCAAELEGALDLGSTSEALSAPEVDLIAIGSLDSSGADRSAQTAAALRSTRTGSAATTYLPSSKAWRLAPTSSSTESFSTHST